MITLEEAIEYLKGDNLDRRCKEEAEALDLAIYYMEYILEASKNTIKSFSFEFKNDDIETVKEKDKKEE